jgi:hypothetical protein
LALLHPVLMSVDVAVTANHWWADGFVCGVLLVLCIAAERVGSRVVRSLRVPTVLEPVPA